MRGALLKKRYGIPATLLLILLVLTGVTIAFVVASFTYSTKTEEPLTFTTTDDLWIKYQGQWDNIKVKASNACSTQGYGIFVDMTLQNGQVDNITYSFEAISGTQSSKSEAMVSTERQSGVDYSNDGDTWDARYNIKDNEAYKIVVTVDSADNAAPDNLSVVLDFHRKAKY